MVRLLHTADWQIGKLYGAFEPADAALLAEARFEAVERLAARAAAERVDMVLVAGDVFDVQGVSDRTIHRLFNATAAFAGPWVMIPGNHDAALAESVWTRAQRLGAIPASVHACLEPVPLLLDAIGVALLPAPLTQRHTYADLTAWFDGADTPAGLLRIGLAHGSVEGILAEGIDSANPIAADRAARAGLDYLALGDWHGARQVDERTWYSGTPETDRFRNNDSGRALCVEIAARGTLPRVESVPTGRYRWSAESFALQVSTDVDALLQRLARCGPDDVLQLTLTGATDLAGHRRLQAAIVQAQGRARSVRCDQSALRLDPTDDDIAALRADGYVGEAIAELRAAQQGGDVQAALARDALALLAGLLDERREAA